MALKREKNTGAAKPRVDLKSAWVDDSLGDGYEFLWGIPLNHENEALNGKTIHTSYIVSIEGNLVETRRAVYNVLSWDETKVHPQADLF